MKIDPTEFKNVLRVLGTALVGMRAAMPAPWGEVCMHIGEAMIIYTVTPLGAVQSTDVTSILNAARQVVPQGTELRIRTTPAPAPDPTKAA
jgi:hypothetical protein